MESQQPTAWPQKIEKILFIIVMRQEAQNLIQELNFKPSATTHKAWDLYEASYNNKQLYLIQGKECPLYNVCTVGSDEAAVLT